MSKTIKKLIAPVSAFIASAIIPSAVMAENLVPNDIAGTTNIVAIVRGIIEFILVIAFVLAFIMLLVGGIRWILAGGDEKAVGSARNTITAALIGLVIILAAYALIRVVETFFKINILTNIGIPQPDLSGQPPIKP